MVMTVLEATVEPASWDKLKQAFSVGSSRRPKQIVDGYLVQSKDDPTLWRAISLWQSREALEEYRRSVEVPGGVLIFRAAGAEPRLAIFDVVNQLQ